MVKPAYLPEHRINGTINGRFHEDGSVFSAEDFRKVSGKDECVQEYPMSPKWYQEDMHQLDKHLKDVQK
jgi:hypothetical protein